MFDKGKDVHHSDEIIEWLCLKLLLAISKLIPEILYRLSIDSGFGKMKTGRRCHLENIDHILMKMFKESEF